MTNTFPLIPFRAARRSYPRRLLASWMLFCLAPAASLAAGFQDLEALRATAETWLRARTADLPGTVTVTVAPADRHLKLAACPQPEPQLPPGTRPWGRFQITVRCVAPERWQVSLPAQVRVRGAALFTSRPLQRGRPIVREDLEVRPSDLTELPPGVLSDPAMALGREPTLALAAGLPLRGDVLRSTRVIQYGQTVSLVYEENGLRVVAEGKALGEAGIGDALKVRSPSGKTLQGVVIAPGEVAVH